jgi:hypothetical protein
MTRCGDAGIDERHVSTARQEANHVDPVEALGVQPDDVFLRTVPETRDRREVRPVLPAVAHRDLDRRSLLNRRLTDGFDEAVELGAEVAGVDAERIEVDGDRSIRRNDVEDAWPASVANRCGDRDRAGVDPRVDTGFEPEHNCIQTSYIISAMTIWTVDSARQAGQAPTEVPLAGLARVFQPAGMRQDPAEEGRADFANARIVLPDDPTRDDIGAASAVSARLGFNMTGMMLPPVSRASELSASDQRPLIVIGANQPRVPASVKARVETLKPGQGLAVWADGAVIVAGSTPAGTRAAAEAFAGRSPYLWDLPGRDTSASFDRVAADLAGLLRSAGIEIKQVSFDEIVFERNRDDAISATVSAAVGSGSAGKARRAIEALKDRHQRGQEIDRLNYSGVVDLVIRLNDGKSVETVTLTRVNVPARR